MSITIREALQRASFCLRQAGYDNARREAEALLTACLDVPLSWLYAHSDESLEPDAAHRYRQWVQRRAGGEPYAYLAGEKEFMGLPFYVTPDVLIPRPETEFLVESVASGLKNKKNPRILDVGAGSGAVAVTLAVLLPGADVAAVDISRAALAIAAQNAARHHVTARLRLLQGDLYAPVAGEYFDAVVSNPPYIPSAEIDLLQPDVREHEPRLALDGGEDGLAFYRRLTAELSALAALPPLLAFEVGYGQAEAVAALCLGAGYEKTHRICDLAGIPRIITAILT